MSAVSEEKDAYRAGFERFARSRRGGVRARVAPRAAHRRLRALRRGGPADAARRGLAPHAARAAHARRASSRPTPRPRPARRRARRSCPRRPRGRGSSRQRRALARAVGSTPATPGVEVAEPARRARVAPGEPRAVARPRRGRRDRAPSPQLNTRPRRGRGRGADRAGRASLEAPIRVEHVGAGAAPGASRTRARWSWPGRGSECRIVESFASAGGARLAHERGDRGRARGRRPRRPLQAAAGGRGRAPRRDARRAARARRALLRPLARARRRALARRHRRALRRRGRRVRARRPLRRRRPPRRRHPLADRPRAAALLEPRALQGHPRRARRAASSTASWSCARARRRPTPGR